MNLCTFVPRFAISVFEDMKPIDLTQGSIFRSLWVMAVPLISASFVQMAYSMTDMLWLGHLGSDAVAAAGAAGEQAPGFNEE